jgi:hypothetical protein
VTAFFFGADIAAKPQGSGPSGDRLDDVGAPSTPANKTLKPWHYPALGLLLGRPVKPELCDRFDGQKIIVTRAGTDMMTAYRNASDRPNLVLTRSWLEPTVSSPEISSFVGTPFRLHSARRVSSGGLSNEKPGSQF